MADTRVHGTAPIGEAHPMVKITEDQAREIKWRIAGGQNRATIAQAMGPPVNKNIVKLIRTRKTWPYVSTAGEEFLDEAA
jgi:hypothetical protein